MWRAWLWVAVAACGTEVPVGEVEPVGVGPIDGAPSSSASPRPEAQVGGVAAVGTPAISQPDCTPNEDGSWPAAWTACQTDDDCTEINVNHCPCSAGGVLKPIAAEYSGCVVFAAPPVGHLCPQVYLCDDLEPLCAAGVCTRG